MSRVPELSWLSVCEVGLGIIGLRVQGLCRVSKLHLLVYLHVPQNPQPWGVHLLKRPVGEGLRWPVFSQTFCCYIAVRHLQLQVSSLPGGFESLLAFGLPAAVESLSYLPNTHVATGFSKAQRSSRV